MRGWKKISLGEACVMNAQSYSSKEHWNFINYLDTGNITENRIKSIQYIDLNNEKLPSRARRKVKKDSIIYSTVRPNQRHFGIIKSQPEHFLVSTGFAVIDVNEKILNADFLYFLLTQNTLIESLHTIAEQSTSAYPSIKTSDLKNLEINIPDLSSQGKIARILSSIGDKIELNYQISQNLEKQAQGLFKSWFVDYEPFGAKKPNGWEQLSFSSFLTERKEKSDDSDLPLFSVTDNGIFPREKKFKKKLSKSGTKNKVLYNTDLVFGMSRKILNWGIMREPVGGVSSAYNVFAVDKQINSKYLESYIKAHQQQFNDLIRPASREGQGIDKAVLMNKIIAIPPAQILEEYYQLEDSLTRMIDCLQEQSQALIVIRDTLLPKLMSGEFDVSDLDI